MARTLQGNRFRRRLPDQQPGGQPGAVAPEPAFLFWYQYYFATRSARITMEGDFNGAIHVPSTAYRNKFSGTYEYRLITGGVGHNIPQKAPQAFAQAVIDADRL